MAQQLLDEVLGVADNLENEDVSLLMQAWRTEVSCPEILPYNEVVDRLVDALKEQKNSIETDLQQITSDEADMVYTYDMDVQRIQYCVAKYLRTRLIKINQQALHIMATPLQLSYLSPQERQYLEEFASLNASFMHEILFSKLDSQTLVQKLENAKDALKDAKPSLHEFVFVMAVDDLGDVDVGGSERHPMEAGHIAIMSYTAAQPYVTEGKMILL